MEIRSAEKSADRTIKKVEKSVGVGSSRLQDKGLQEMRDGGYCLSMHQPWASLLVAGIKRCVDFCVPAR